MSEEQGKQSINQNGSNEENPRTNQDGEQTVHDGSRARKYEPQELHGGHASGSILVNRHVEEEELSKNPPLHISNEELERLISQSHLEPDEFFHTGEPAAAPASAEKETESGENLVSEEELQRLIDEAQRKEHVEEANASVPASFEISDEELQALMEESDSSTESALPAGSGNSDQITPEELQRLLDGAQEESEEESVEAQTLQQPEIDAEKLQALVEEAGGKHIEKSINEKSTAVEVTAEELQALLDAAVQESGDGVEEPAAGEEIFDDTPPETPPSAEVSAEELQALLDGAAQESGDGEEEPAAGEEIFDDTPPETPASAEVSAEELQALLDAAMQESGDGAEEPAAGEEIFDDAPSETPPSTEVSAEELQALLDAAMQETGDGAEEPTAGEEIFDDAPPETPVSAEVSAEELQALLDAAMQETGDGAEEPTAGEEIFDDTPPETSPAAETGAEEAYDGSFNEMLDAWKAEEGGTSVEVGESAEQVENAQDGTAVAQSSDGEVFHEDEFHIPGLDEEIESVAEEEAAQEGDEIIDDETQPEEPADEAQPAEETQEGEAEELLDEGDEKKDVDEFETASVDEDIDLDALLSGAESRAKAEEAARAAKDVQKKPAAETRPQALDNRTMWIVAIIVALIVLCTCLGSLALIFIYQEDLGIRISMLKDLPLMALMLNMNIG